MAFILRKYKNQYYLKNDNLTSSTYTVIPAENCCSCEVESITPQVLPINAGQEVLLSFNSDGRYIVRQPGSGTVLTSFTINYFPKLEARLIKDAKAFLCGDGCLDCNRRINKDKVDNLSKYQNIFNEILTYHLINGYDVTATGCENSKKSEFIYRAANLYNCDIQKELCIQLNSSDYYGKYTGSLELFSKFIAIYYVSFYFDQFFQTDDADERKYIDDLYDICEIQRCIRKLGIDFDALEELYTSIQDDDCPGSIICPDNLPPSVLANFTIDFQTVLENYVFTLNDFYDGYTDPEGNMIENIKFFNAGDVGSNCLRLTYGIEIVDEDTIITQQGIIDGLLVLSLTSNLCGTGSLMTLNYTASDQGSHEYSIDTGLIEVTYTP